jgi:hypothetical protein
VMVGSHAERSTRDPHHAIDHRRTKDHAVNRQ